MSGPYAKQVQAFSPGLNSTAACSAGFYRPSSAAPINNRRSQTSERGFRDMNPKEQSFNYDRPIRDEVVRESIQSPYMNGKKNQHYINPTFQSTSFLNQSFETQRSQAVAKVVGAPMQRAVSQASLRTNVEALLSPKNNQEVRPPVPNKRVEIATNNEVTEIRPTQNIRDVISPKGDSSARITRTTSELPAGILRGRQGRNDSVNRGNVNAQNANQEQQELNVCEGCVNYQMADEVNERKKNTRKAELELETEILDRNAYGMKMDKEYSLRKREIVCETSKANFESFKERAHRNASRERGEEDADLKVNINQSVAIESLRTIQRYQSMLDKMYESSVKKIGERKDELKSRQQHNKNTIKKHEKEVEVKGRVKESGFHFKGDKSMLDTMYQNTSQYLEAQSGERRRASEYNYKSNECRERSRMYSPPAPLQDPFKPNTDNLEEAGVGSGMLDKMYYTSMDRWGKVKQGVQDTSRSNREASASKKSRAKNDDGLDQWSGYQKNWKEEGVSVLDHVYVSDQQGLSYRKNVTQDCSSHNREIGFSPEKHQLKNLESYYKSPTKKVNDPNVLDHDNWTEKGSVLTKINAAADKLEHERREQYGSLGGSIKKQMIESAIKRNTEQVQNKNFKETPLLVCAHNSNVMYCNVCNRKVPMNKISKIVGDYKKLMKGRGRK